MEESFVFYVKQKMRLDFFLQKNLRKVLATNSSASEKLSAELKSENQISNSKIRRLIIAHKVFVDEKNVALPSFMLKKNERVKVLFDKNKFFFEKPTKDLDFTLDEKNVLFEDDVILVVNKPAFLPTEKTFVEGRKNLHDCAVEYLWKKNPELKNPPYVGIMHRLDLETSGTVLFTKSRTVNKAFHEMFENREIKKIYFAVCTLKNKNQVPAEIGESFFVENYLLRISLKSQPCKMGIVKKEAGALLSKTRFKIVKKFSLADFEDFVRGGKVCGFVDEIDSLGEEVCSRSDGVCGFREKVDSRSGKIRTRSENVCSKDVAIFSKGENFFSQSGNSQSKGEKFDKKVSGNLKTSREYFLVECELFTGRTHQIRVHLSSLGLPILGDELYGGDKNLLEKSGRIMLHAQSLSFVHPLTKEKLTVRAPCLL